jgi:hypothetical protein
MSLGVFVGCTLLNLLLQCAGNVIMFCTMGPPNQTNPGEIWLWFVAFPVMLARHLHLDVPQWVRTLAWLLNAPLYGGMGWCAWGMLKPMWRKPESNPEHGEEN